MHRTTKEHLPLRRIARKYVLQYLYQVDMDESPQTTITLINFWSQAEEMHDRLGEKEWAKTQTLVEQYIEGIAKNRVEIDEIIQERAVNWRIERMAVVDRNILRLAVYEFYYCPDIPPVVTINEAVDLAKGFSAAESGAFVNGMLDEIRKSLPKGNPEPPPPGISAATP